MREDWLDRVRNVRQWARKGERAAHKPLLLLLMLGRVRRGHLGPIAFTEVEKLLDPLLRDFGPPRQTEAAYPFRYLANDGLWVITDAEGNGTALDARPGALRAAGAIGRLEPEFERALATDPVLLASVVRHLLDANFAPSLHADLIARTGLGLEVIDIITATDRRRDPAFREAVLDAYDYRCAMCGYDGYLKGQSIGVDAAHVRWWAIEGPDATDNGMALCALHHRLFDGGVLGIAVDEDTVTVSSDFESRSPAAVVGLAGAPLRGPRAGEPPVAREHREWHVHAVFRGPAWRVA
ncbi:phosphorothioated DNA-binding restriction endonuclease [Actinokineospora sp. UTMC 2448]|uniref:phosphorothioated DNA-binding restriction endonuclease n=1 Tax=Actinokineospora sp. UTMC 2448 TaxID=2268449 RepID=UPI00216440F2|nr:HNH endonuclease [Actinokineospora sp. UTMC 2448]UVS79091.1 hypothetical protein Actkin_02833 [Actinokineospora sp. UTMC 2448]